MAREGVWSMVVAIAQARGGVNILEGMPTAISLSPTRTMHKGKLCGSRNGVAVLWLSFVLHTRRDSVGARCYGVEVSRRSLCSAPRWCSALDGNC